MKAIATKIVGMSGSVIRVPGRGIGYGELAHVITPARKLLAQVIRLERGFVDLQIFSGAAGVSTGDLVEFLGRPAQVSCGANTLGRVFDGVGAPRDKGPPLYENLHPLDREPVNPARRVKASRMLETGIPMIDVFNTLVESQKISIFCGPGEPYNELLARIVLQARADVIVLAGIGLRSDDYLFFRDQLERGGVASRSVLFIHTAADPVVECLLTPDMALTVAEEFALEGKRTLVALTDMTNFCDALKEVSIVLDRVPSNRGYPGELYSQLATRYEKAVDFDGAGSITIISVTTMPGDDVTHPAPDNTGYITEGQYYLKNRRIEPFGSLSRLKQLANRRTREDHRYLMNEMIRLYADYQETLEKQAMGFRMAPWDVKLMRYGGLFEERLMDWTVDVPLLRALDIGWEILATCFKPEETGLRRELIHRFWPKSA